MVILLRTLQFIFGLIFRLPAPVALYFMHFAGEITYQVARLTPVKSMAARNVRRVLPAADSNKVADQLLKNTAYSIFELICAPFFKEAHLSLITKVAHQDNLDVALADRKGVLLLHMHTGNYELTPVILSHLGYRIVSILKATKDPIFKFLSRSRMHGGTRIVNVLETDMYREALKALGQNEVVGTLVDTGALDSRHEMLTFLGRQLPVATGWLTLAQRSAAAVIPGIAKREGKIVVVTLGEPLRVTDENRQQVMHTVSQFYENFIKNHPDQWGMFLNEYETKRMVEGR